MTARHEVKDRTEIQIHNVLLSKFGESVPSVLMSSAHVTSNIMPQTNFDSFISHTIKGFYDVGPFYPKIRGVKVLSPTVNHPVPRIVDSCT